jgi:hypothetical protein
MERPKPTIPLSAPWTFWANKKKEIPNSLNEETMIYKLRVEENEEVFRNSLWKSHTIVKQLLTT